MSLLNKVKSGLTSEERRAVAYEVANLFFEAERQGNLEKSADQFGDILCQLLVSMAPDRKAQLASQMAHTPNAPHNLTRDLAEEDIQIAKPILEFSTVLTDEDLLNITARKSKEHRIAVGRRENLSEKVTDQLISHNEVEVLRTVAANTSAKISTDGFASLSKQSARDETLLKSLISRDDIDESVADEIMSQLDETGKASLENMLKGQDGKFSALVAKSKEMASNQKINHVKLRIDAKSIYADIEQGRMSFEEAIIRLVQERRPKCIAYLLAQKSQLSETKVYHSLLSVSGDLLAMICRGTEMPFSIYSQVEALRCETLRLPTPDKNSSYANYSNLEEEATQRVLRLANVVSAHS
ncbi:DUF2336 domain-containing protein [Maritalea sp. S77]|uniref:DUF2336 domain-containing protein n=1 Tax=Maritalea sp. S77 TaxID=3415125 RepID=UPI003C7A5B96